ncbi:type IV pili methyl-accepting chemotaxis transducer N-terminal domain-containing protein [Caballeronia sp. GAOx1]|uniref:type IV pili methyl-accepting chemotaxis transducer N-terminal domain-containing protein n=1 Tax=Caballeronia sp. GAOx1 TaxID=2921761 RepID=UPI0020288138|nr:type IV pili methyl-accepting chemotaxis transducer N-terminal domain-containing protein [Caballeronia sp. GAOx1]
MFLSSFREHLTTRIVTLSMVSLVLVLAMIGGTLWLSWQLQGAGAAINDAGSLRMRANAVAIALLKGEKAPSPLLQLQIEQMNATLDRLRKGDPARPLFLPDDVDVRRQFDHVANAWHSRLEPDVREGMASADPQAVARYLLQLRTFVTGADDLVGLIERENARKTAWLRTSQMALAAMACIGTAAIVYLLFLWIVVPVQRLQDGLARIEAREFDARLPVETQDEFGHLAAGFNRMAAELQTLYRDLAGRVEAKTAELAAQNRELTALYEMAAFVNQPNDVDALCRGFLARLMRQFDADGAAVRLFTEDGQVRLIGSEGLPAALLQDESCFAADACACAQRSCQRAGFASVAAFSIVSQGEKLGAFSLHFGGERTIPATEAHLLETLGTHFGTALKNRRLAALARQLAVSEERNLVAQGLHDSIAQSLNFMKMQVHLLDAATREERMDEIREIVPMLTGGLAESYDDVRELLMNFRTRLGTGDLRRAVNESVERFGMQTGIAPSLDYREEGGLPLPPDQQLQVLFILQEALSNIRKHAEAQRVFVTIVNGRDFSLLVEDDGQGYDPKEMAVLGETHVGFHIMRERAQRLGAILRLTGAPACGARVELVLPAPARQAV